MPPTIVYLDQNKWIQLARYFLVEPDPALESVVDAIARAGRDGSAVFPISFGHYIETRNCGDAHRRLRLSFIMTMISDGATFSSRSGIVGREIDEGLSLLFPGRITARPFRLIAVDEGIAHAGGRSIGSLSPMAEFAALATANPVTGKSFSGARPDSSDLEKRFESHLERLRSSLNECPRQLRGLILAAAAFDDIKRPIHAALAHHGISPSEFVGALRNGDRLEEFVACMPSRRVEMHLNAQWAANPRLRTKRTDLGDWSNLGAAVAYADIVVTEKHFASLVTRPGLKASARVLTRLEDLPPLLTSA